MASGVRIAQATLGRQSERDHGAASRDRDVLLALAEVADRRRDDPAAGLEAPKRFSCPRVEREELAFFRPREQQAARVDRRPDQGGECSSKSQASQPVSAWSARM